MKEISWNYFGLVTELGIETTVIPGNGRTLAFIHSPGIGTFKVKWDFDVEAYCTRAGVFKFAIRGANFKSVILYKDNNPPGPPRPSQITNASCTSANVIEHGMNYTTLKALGGNEAIVDSFLGCFSSTFQTPLNPTNTNLYDDVQSTIDHEHVHRMISERVLTDNFSELIELVEAFSAPLSQFDSAEEAAEWFKSGTAFEDMQRVYSQLAFDAMGGVHNPWKEFYDAEMCSSGYTAWLDGLDVRRKAQSCPILRGLCLTASCRPNRSIK